MKSTVNENQPMSPKAVIYGSSPLRFWIKKLDEYRSSHQNTFNKRVMNL